MLGVGQRVSRDDDRRLVEVAQLRAHCLRRQVDDEASQQPAGRNTREIIGKKSERDRFRFSTCPGMTVTSVPDQPMSAKRLHIVVDSRLIPMARQNWAQRATASAGGHDTVYTVMGHLFRSESSGRRGSDILQHSWGSG